MKRPNGVLLITPESLEALFVNRGPSIPGMMANIKYIVIDELHAFIGFERGKQIQSLMHRVELAIGRQVPALGSLLLSGICRSRQNSCALPYLIASSSSSQRMGARS